MAVLGEETQITCKFTTKLPKEYRVPPSTVVRAVRAVTFKSRFQVVEPRTEHEWFFCRLYPLS